MQNATPFYRRPRLALLGLLGLASLTAQAQTAPTWSRVLRTSSTSANSASFARKVAVAPDGSQYLTGVYSGTITLGPITLTAGPGAGHLYLAKCNAAGTVLWATDIEAASGDLYINVAADAAGNAYVAGYFAGSITFGPTTLASTGNDAFVAKFNAQGVLQWARQGGTPGTFVQGVAVDAAGTVTLAGDCVSAVSFGSATPLAGNGPFVAKLSTTGTAQPPKRVGSRGFTNEMTTDAAGNAYLVGAFTGSTQFGATTLNSAGDQDIFLTKLDPAGTVLWAVRSGTILEDNGLGVAVDGNGNPVVAGYSDGIGTTNFTSNIYVARFTNQGIPVWTRQIAPATADEVAANAVVYDGRGGYYITGSISSATVFGATTLTTQFQDAYVVRYDSQGSVLWAGQSVSAGSAGAAGLGLAADASGSVYVAGGVAGAVTFGTLATTNPNTDSFLAKLTPGGTVAAARPATAALKLSAYPNPATGQATLLLPVGGGRLTVLDALGRPVREQTLPAGAGPAPVSVAGLAPGLYQLRATFSDGQVGTTALAVR